MRSRANTGALVVVSVLTVSTSEARTASADQCVVLDGKVATRARQTVKRGDKFVEFCEGCGDQRASAPATVTSVQTKVWSKTNRRKFRIEINGKTTDLSRIYVLRGSEYLNLALLAKCGTRGVSLRLPPNAATNLDVHHPGRESVVRTSPRHMPTRETDQHTTLLAGGETFTFAAELGTTPDILGMGFERNLKRTDAKGVAHRVYPTKTVEVPTNHYDVDFQMIENSLELEAHGRYLFVRAGVKKSKSSRYLVARAYQIDKIIKLKPEGAPLATAPLYASKIYYGWALYVVIEGEASSFTTDIAASLMNAGAKLSAKTKEYKLKSKVHAIGLRPKNRGEVVIATTLDDIKRSFTTLADPQPIFVEYTLTENTNVNAIPWEKNTFRPGRYRVQVTAALMETKPDGKGWDVLHGYPDPLVVLVLDGREIKSCMTKDAFESTCLRDVIVDVDANTTIAVRVSDKDRSYDDPVGATETLSVMSSGGVPGVPIPLKAGGGLKNVSVTLTPVH